MAAQLGKYQLVAEIARGGMGIVYLAVSQGPARFSKLLVVKELKPEFVEDETFLEMFLEEARLAARLSHQNIVQTYEVGEEDRRHYIVMDYLDGVTLARLLRRKSTLFTRNMHLRVIADAGLHYAHTLKDFDGSALGIVHRDVTPQNVFLTFDGSAKLVDFGIAKALDSSIETRTGVMKGKPAYMSPEQIAGDVDPRADVFSAGVMIWEAIAGRRMWAKKGDVEVLASMLRGEVPSLREHVSDVPDELELIVKKCLAKNRDERFESAGALQEALEQYLASDPSVPTTNMREVGRVVSEIFTEERTTTRALIETHLARLKSGATTPDKLPSLIPPPADMSSKSPPESERSLTSGISSSGSSSGTPAGASLSMNRHVDNVSVPPPFSIEENSSRGSSSKRIWIIAAAALLLTGVGFALGMNARSTPTTTTTATGKALPSSTEPPPPAVSSEATPPPSAPPAVALTTPPPEKSVEKKSSPPPTRLAWTPPPRPSPAQPPPRPPPTPTPTSTPEGRAPEPSDSKLGYLTLDTYPWTRVSTGGKVLGDTPLVRVPLSPGSHVLVLENTTEKVKQTTVVNIKAGETVSKRLAF